MNTMIQTCEARIGTSLETINGFPRNVPVICTQTVGLRSYVGLDEDDYFYCGIEGHEESVRHAHPERTLCACASDRHKPTGCPEWATQHPETDEPSPCSNCAPWASTGLHGVDFSAHGNPYNVWAGYSRDDIEATLADRELMADEFHRVG